MPLTDYYNWLHGKAAPAVGVAIGASGDEYSEDELNFGVANPNIGRGNAAMGLHVLIMETFNNLTSVLIGIVHGAATSPTTLLVQRYFALAALTARKHYFIPIPPSNLQYVRAYFDLTGSNPTTGKVCMWIGPDVDGTE